MLVKKTSHYAKEEIEDTTKIMDITDFPDEVVRRGFTNRTLTKVVYEFKNRDVLIVEVYIPTGEKDEDLREQVRRM